MAGLKRPVEHRLPGAVAGWGIAVLALGSVIAVVAHAGELRRVATLLRHARASWIVAACIFQATTYLLAAAIWDLALRRRGARQPLSRLMMFALALLFSNQAVPSAGLSGGVIVTTGLVERGVTENAAMSALAFGLVTANAAFLLAFAASLPVIRDAPRLDAVAIGAGIVFTIMAGGIVLFLYSSPAWSSAFGRTLKRLPVVGRVVATVTAPEGLIRDVRTLAFGIAMQLVEIVLDGATFWVALAAIGHYVRVPLAFGAYVIAEVVSRVAFVPLGIGTFEGTAVAVLHAGGVPLEPALAGTLLLRAFTLWLPMLPGLWSARRAVKARA